MLTLYREREEETEREGERDWHAHLPPQSFAKFRNTGERVFNNTGCFHQRCQKLGEQSEVFANWSLTLRSKVPRQEFPFERFCFNDMCPTEDVSLIVQRNFANTANVRCMRDVSLLQ